MTSANKKSNIKEELKRGDSSFHSANILFKEKQYLDAMSRLYYSAFHYLKALLLTKGLEPKSHQGAIHLFSQHFVKTKIFNSSFNRILSGMQKFREESDYNPSWIIDKKDLTEEMEKANSFQKKVKAYLKKKKLL